MPLHINEDLAVQVSIIVLTFNSIRFVKPCLDSIYEQSYINFELIVVDNGSCDGTATFIKNKYHFAKIIENKENLGACYARNQGINLAKGKWILTLDCDVVLGPDFLRILMAASEESDTNIGVFQPKILKSDKNTIYSCGIYLSFLRRFYDIGSNKADSQEFNKSKFIFGACCAAALYRNDILKMLKEKTGYFDERFFFLVEDVDLSWRIAERGYKTLYLPEAVCFHSGNSSGAPKDLRQYFCFRNRYLMIDKNEPIFRKFVLFILSFCYDIPRFIYFVCFNKYVLKRRATSVFSKGKI